MGYNLRFGEFEVESEPEERWARASASFSGIELPADAPYDSSGTGGRGPDVSAGYGVWNDFAMRHHIDDMFFGGKRRDGSRQSWWGPDGQERLLAIHHGAAPLTEECHRRFAAARDAHFMSYAEAVPVLENWLRIEDWGVRQLNPPPEAVWDAIRLNWLAFWTRFTLDNTEFPTFANS